MNNAVPQVSASMDDIPFTSADLLHRRDTGAHPSCIDELAHELRQPLSAIESLAYYLEITAADDETCTHLQQIRLMVNRASRILDQAAA